MRRVTERGGARAGGWGVVNMGHHECICVGPPRRVEERGINKSGGSCCLVLYSCLQCLISQSCRKRTGTSAQGPRAQLSGHSSTTCLKSFRKAKIKRQEKQLAANARIEMKSVQGKDPCSDLRLLCGPGAIQLLWETSSKGNVVGGFLQFERFFRGLTHIDMTNWGNSFYTQPPSRVKDLF